MQAGRQAGTDVRRNCLSVWSLHVLPVFPRVDTLTKTCCNPGLYTASPGQPGCLLDEGSAGVPDGGEGELVGIT